jgi:serine/threonine protein kinase/sugar lactone lactonase YvrE
MPFSVGDRLGRFEILGSLGAGGMGEVYRAHDPQLKRDVAIKVLPPALFDRPDRRRRFEQEARAAGGLSHPNILAVFEVGVDGTTAFIVTELLEGGTLRERMGGRALSARKAGEYAAQVASGLAAAHDRGVVHRDIKPDNLFVTTDGRIKILDFGLAKLVGPEPSGDTDTITVDGEPRAPVIGTVAYMSPEQAQGLKVDHRTDIFSLGVVLYEMMTGLSPFRRDSTSHTLNAIVHDEPPDITRVETATPTLERIVRRCLEKRPEERFQNARDLAFSLEMRSQDTGAVSPARRRSRWRSGVVAGVSLLALVAAAGLGALAAARMSPPAPDLVAHRVRLMTDFVGLEEFSSISPDGKMLAFTATQGGRSQVFVRILAGGGQPLPLTSDDQDHQSPRWLPDGSALVYFSPAAPGEVQGTIHKVPALGGEAQRVIASIGGGDVNSEGRVACFRLENDRIQLVTSTLEGSDIRVVSALKTWYYRYPRWSPDKEWIAYQAGDGFRWEIYVIPASGGSAVRLTEDNTLINGLAWLPDSQGVIFSSARGSTVAYLPPMALWEVKLDGKQLRQLTPAESSYEQPDASLGGLVAATRLRMQFDIWSYPFAKGALVSHGTRLTRQTGQVLTPTVAPDGRQIAYLSDSGGHGNIWVTSPQGPPLPITRDTDPSVVMGVPIWSPDGRWIAFVSSGGNVGLGFSVSVVRPDGSQLRRLLPRGIGVAWSPDSQWLYYVESAATPMKKISISGGEPVVVRAEPVRNVIGVFGSTVYFMVDSMLLDGRPQYEIKAAPVDGGPAWKIQSIDASRVSSWQVVNPSLSPDGKWLALPLTDGFTTNIWAISTDTGRWQQVTDFRDRFMFIARRVSWSHDGKSILAAVGEGDADVVLLDGLIRSK